MLERFEGATAVVTGAGSGLGLELARAAARRGMRLVLVDVQAQAMNNAAQELRQAGAQVLEVTLSVADAAAMDGLAQAVVQD